MQVIRPNGTTLDFDYDSQGLLETQTFPAVAPSSGLRTLQFDYDAEGNRLLAMASDGTMVNHTYDNASRIENSTWQGEVTGGIQRTHDAVDRLKTIQINTESPIVYDYDAGDLLVSAGAMTFSQVGVDGQLGGSTLGSVSDSTTYAGLILPETYQAMVSGSPLLRFDYTYDILGRITGIEEEIEGQIRTFEYTYDAAGQVKEAKQDGSVVRTYLYDPNGNRSQLITPSETIDGTYDDHDRMLTYDGVTYDYDAYGNLQQMTESGQVTTYGYDALGNLLTVNLPDGRLIEYVVDGENRRVGKKVDGVLQNGYLYHDQLNPIAELDGNGNTISQFIYATRLNAPDYMIKGGVTYRIISDHLGSPRLVVNTASGAIVQRMDYDEFGNIVVDTNPGFQPFGFAGGLYDPDTNFIRFGARDYDPKVGRWTAKDPILFQGRSSNLYVYAVNNPVNFLDLDGRLTLTQALVAISLAGLANATSTLKRQVLGEQPFDIKAVLKDFLIGASVAAGHIVLVIAAGPFSGLAGILFLGGWDVYNYFMWTLAFDLLFQAAGFE